MFFDFVIRKNTFRRRLTTTHPKLDIVYSCHDPAPLYMGADKIAYSIKRGAQYLLFIVVFVVKMVYVRLVFVVTYSKKFILPRRTRRRGEEKTMTIFLRMVD